jgi:cytochrome c peroxidase
MLWHRCASWLLICFLSCLLAISLSHMLVAQSVVEYQWGLPAWVPKPIVPATNPMTAAKVELGRYLFYERRLSVTGTQSCASCHIQYRAFTDGKLVGVGATGEHHPRNSMSLANIAYNSVLTWANPLMTKLEAQGLVPLFGEHPVELGMAGKEQEILNLLQTDDRYQLLFKKAFEASKTEINLNNMMKAIASFERSLVSFNSPYDHYRYGGDPNAISASAKRGEALFNSEKLECFHCHSGINFSDSTVHERLAFPEIAFHNTGLYNIDGQGAYPPNNSGTYEITSQPRDMGRFKAPTLRNIELTAPYMHDGSVATLADAIAHYQVGGRTIKSGAYSGIGSANPLKSNFIAGFKLTDSDQQDLLAFLRSLTDLSFTQNPAFSDPFLSKIRSSPQKQDNSLQE